MSPKTALDMTPDMLRQYKPFKLKEGRVTSISSAAEARGVAVSIAEELRHRFGAKRVVLFGSLARDEFGRWSDIDLAAWGIPASDFYRVVAFVTGYSRTWSVDLVDVEDCSPTLRAAIEQEGVDL
jgi:predicted nucleotidyltransferase